jgi:hypothetical protein
MTLVPKVGSMYEPPAGGRVTDATGRERTSFPVGHSPVAPYVTTSTGPWAPSLESAWNGSVESPTSVKL